MTTLTHTPSHIARRFQLAHRHAPPPVHLGPGSREDYLALARLHYRTQAPATLERILKAVCQRTNETVGVLVTSRPTLNATWRAIAWPGRFDTGSKSERALRLNRELRTISRVIVDPRYRGLGLAKQLVRAYLDTPDTPCTEALAAMGTISPFFERAGMRRIEVPEHPRDQRLRQALQQHASEPIDLLASAELQSQLETELRLWAGRSASTRRLATGAVELIARDAVARLVAPISAYAHQTD